MSVGAESQESAGWDNLSEDRKINVGYANAYTLCIIRYISQRRGLCTPSLIYVCRTVAQKLLQYLDESHDSHQVLMIK